jgi:hypothetical protein
MSAAPAPVQDEESIPWEQLTSNTGDLSAKVDTAPQSSHKDLSPSRKRLASKTADITAQERYRIWFVVIVVSVVIVAGLGYLVWKVVQQPGKKSPGRTPLRVNKEGKAGDFKTIREALERARPGDKILVAGGRYEEQLVLRGRRGITIEADIGEVVIVPPANLKKHDPLLELYACEQVHIKRLKFDGQKKMPTLVTLAGFCPDLHLDQVKLEMFTQAAVVITNCAGERERDKEVMPVQLTGIKTSPPDLLKPVPAISFRLNKNVRSPSLNDHIHIKDPTFQGKYKTTKPIVFSDKNILGDDVLLDGKPLVP